MSDQAKTVTTPSRYQKSCMEALNHERESSATDPQSNPVRHLAGTISRDLEAGRVTLDDLDHIVRGLTRDAMRDRARRLGERAGLSETKKNESRIHDAIKAAAGRARSFRAFRTFLETVRFGSVFTAHPTFALSRELYDVLAAMVEDEGGASKTLAERKALTQRQAPDDRITLSDEHEAVQDALLRCSEAFLDVRRTVLETAAEIYPDRWREIAPTVMSAASWVGYDLDGRNDISWRDSFVFRLQEKARRLSWLAEKAETALADAPKDPAAEALGSLIASITLAAAETDEAAEAFAAAGDEADLVAAPADRLTEQTEGRMTDPVKLADSFKTIAKTAKSDPLARTLLALAGELLATGFGTGEIHLRINATQLHNAMRGIVENNEASPLRRTLAQLAELAKKAERVQINFGSLMDERATARRQFILAAQILKHIDRKTPIRLLIAECEQPSTVMIAIYLARLFGIDDRLDISPLFETPDALERGARLMGQLLETPEFRSVVTRRGRVCIQTGFSDAGRFIGQPAATLAIERLHFKICEVMREMGFGGIELVIFNTHGESMGRGAHPAGLGDRLDYLLTPAARHTFDEAGIPIRHEVSFQGGDGYLFFQTPALARATALSLLATELDEPKREPDPFYVDTDYSLDFFLHLKAWQERMFSDPDYGTLLDSFGPNLLFQTGSRATKRQLDPGVAVRTDPSSIRAIPNNAILQQMGYPANILAGMGEASAMDRDRFVRMASESDRLKRILTLVAATARASSINTLLAFASVLDAGYWAARADGPAEQSNTSALARIAETLLATERGHAIMRLTTRLRLDALVLSEMLEAATGECIPPGAAEPIEIDLLQAIRIACMEHIVLLAAKVPRFSGTDAFSPREMMRRALLLDVVDAVSLLERAFPVSTGVGSSAHFAEHADYEVARAGDYRAIRRDFIEPMEKAYDLVRRIGAGVSHVFGAHG